MDSIFLYVEKNGEITITGLQEGAAETAIEIPETIEGIPVVEIGSEAFRSTSITDIKIGDNVKLIMDTMHTDSNIYDDKIKKIVLDK